MSPKTQIAFFKSYSKLGWWAARLPVSADWGGYEASGVGFGVTTTQAERDLLARERAENSVSALAA